MLFFCCRVFETCYFFVVEFLKRVIFLLLKVSGLLFFVVKLLFFVVKVSGAVILLLSNCCFLLSGFVRSAVARFIVLVAISGGPL